jgi:hypothetical protein
VEKETMLQTFELEKQSGVREPGSTATKAQPTLHSLHGRLAKIRKGFKESGMTHDAIETKLKSMITGVQQQQQSTLSTFFARRYERKTSFRLRAFFDLVFVSQLCYANGLPTLRPSWLKNAPMIAFGLGYM